MKDYAKELAEIALEIKAIKLSPEDPFTWASGYRMPIYNDNRLLLGNYKHRALIAEGFAQLIKTENIALDVVAGTATAGISPGTTLADSLKAPFIYIRSKAKGHGLQNQIEGVLNSGEQVLLIEDLISTGGSSISALEAVREAGGVIETCFSIFSYGLDEAKKRFDGVECQVFSLLTFDRLLEIAIEKEYITQEQQEVLAEWQKDPFGWGEKHGFPKQEKS